MLTDEEKKNAKPLILNTQMVKAILEGRKKRFSKVVEKPIDFEVESTNVINAKDGGISEVELVNFDSDETLFVKPQFKVGDVLYVKESFALETMTFGEEWVYHKEPIVHYLADRSDDYEEPIITPYKTPMCMPKKYARIFLKITDSRLENLQDMSIQDIQNEGIFTLGLTTDLIHQCWQVNWDSTAKDGFKVENEPLIFAFEFERFLNEKE